MIALLQTSQKAFLESAEANF